MKKFILLFSALFLMQFLFSQTLPTNWTGDSGIDTYQESTNINTGTNSCKVIVNTGAQADCDMRHDQVAVTAGNTYTLSYFVYTSAHIKTRTILEWVGATITYGIYSPAGTGGFVEVTSSGTVPAGATAVKVGVRFYDQTGFVAPENQYIDDFTFESPTGSSITLANGNFELWPSGIINPTNLAATPASTSQINTSWIQNASSDNVMLAWSADGTFGTPTDGTAYVTGNTISGGGTIIYNGSLTAYNHTGLTAGTQYYYKAWSVDGSDIYSSGITANATTPNHTSLIISEVTDPSDVYRAKFVEIYNLGATTVDFTTETWYLCRQTNGGSWEDKQLTGSLLASNKYVAANYNADSTDYFFVNYGFLADFDYGGTAGNGNDGYFLFFGGDHTAGTLIDAYGVIDLDGTGTEWEYTDSKAVRLRSIISPNTTWTATEWSIPASANVSDMTPSAHNEDVSWVGNIADWNTKGADCWTGTHNFIPDASFNVTIPSGVTLAPSTSANSETNNLTINASATISYDAPLTVYGDLTVDPTNASLNIASGTTGNGSLIVKGSISGSTDVFRYFEAYTAAADGWHYISSPVNNMIIAGSNFDPTSTNNDLYAWDENDYLWRNYKGSNFPSLNFVDGTGYMVAYESVVTNHFIGTLNNADITYSNLSKTANKGDGWHLLGNPFPSAIKWATSDWALANVGGVAKVYNEAAGSYTDINANEIIPSTNGFFVQVSLDASNNITIPLSARTHDNTNNYKYSPNSTYDETLKLLVNNDENTFYDIASVGFCDEALPSFDWAFDSHKMYGQQIAPQIWTISEGEEYSTNFLPHVYENLDLPLHFKAGTNTTYHIIVQGIENFYQNSEIYLEDLQTNNIIDLREQQIYTFNGKTTDDKARFILHFFGITNINNSSLNDEIQVYGSENKIFIKSTPKLNYNIEVYDIMGRETYSNMFISNGLNTININATNGIYIVKLQHGSSINITKIRL